MAPHHFDSVICICFVCSTWVVELNYSLIKWGLKSGFHRLAGNKELENQIKNQISESEIKKSWEKDLNDFKKIREKYLIYN